VNLLCFNRRGDAQFQETFFQGVPDKRGGRSYTLDVRVRNADLCSVTATAQPESFISVRSHTLAFARASLVCPSGCRLFEPTR
jgi:hypothetical protein